MTMAPAAPEAAPVNSAAIEHFLESMTQALDRRSGGKATGYKHDATGTPTGVG